MAEAVSAIRNRLVLYASEIKQMTGWPDAMVEDYLNIFNDLVEYADAINSINTQVNVPNLRTVSSDTVTNSEDATIVATAELTVTLHSPISTDPLPPIRIKRIGDGGVTVEPVDGDGYILNGNYQAIDVQWTGTEWISL